MTSSRHTLTGTLELSDGSSLDLDVKDGRVALEEARSPYAQINLSTPMPASADMERIDPRANLRAQFTTRQDFGQGGYVREFTAAFPAVVHSYVTTWTGAQYLSPSVLTRDGTEIRRNLSPNPRLSGSTANWSVDISGTFGGGISGRSALQLGGYQWWFQMTWSTPSSAPGFRLIAAGANVIPVTPGVDMYAQMSTHLSWSGAETRLTAYWYTSGGTLISTTPGNATTRTANTIATQTITATPPPTAAFMSISLVHSGGTMPVSGSTMSATAVLVEKAATTNATFFDGATANYSRSVTLAADVTAVYGGKTAAAVSADYFEPWNSFGVRPPTLRNFNVILRSFEADHRAGELGLIFNTDEMLLQDFALLSKDSIAPLTSTVKGAVNLALSMVNAALSPDSLDASVEDVESLVWKPGVSGWDYVEPLVQKAGLRLYCDEQRIWRLTQPQRSVDGFLSLAASSNVTRGIDSVSLDARSEDSWYDGVVVRYEWQDAANVRQTAYDTAGDPATARKVYSLTVSDVPYPGPGAARAILTRSQGRGRVLNVDAISDYSTEPGLPLGISLPNSITQTGFVSAVDWDFPQGVMSVKSRGLVETPPDSWTLTPPELTWATVADDTTWSNFPNIPISGGA